MIDKNVLVEGE